MGEGMTCWWNAQTPHPPPIGYYGRPFEARNKPKGSSFTGDDKDFYRFQIGSGQVIPAWWVRACGRAMCGWLGVACMQCAGGRAMCGWLGVASAAWRPGERPLTQLQALRMHLEQAVPQ